MGIYKWIQKELVQIFVCTSSFIIVLFVIAVMDSYSAILYSMQGRPPVS